MNELNQYWNLRMGGSMFQNTERKKKKSKNAIN